MGVVLGIVYRLCSFWGVVYFVGVVWCGLVWFGVGIGIPGP